jgi:hypothetical protein
LTSDSHAIDEAAADAAWRDIVERFEAYRARFGSGEAYRLADLLTTIAYRADEEASRR